MRASERSEGKQSAVSAFGGEARDVVAFALPEANAVLPSVTLAFDFQSPKSLLQTAPLLLRLLSCVSARAAKSLRRGDVMNGRLVMVLAGAVQSTQEGASWWSSLRKKASQDSPLMQPSHFTTTASLLATLSKRQGSSFGTCGTCAYSC